MTEKKSRPDYCKSGWLKTATGAGYSIIRIMYMLLKIVLLQGIIS